MGNVPGAEPTTGLRVRHEPASVALVRSRLAADLRAHQLADDSIEDAVLVTSELVTNAIRHTPDTGPIEVNWRVDESEITLRVIDSSAAHPERRKTPPVSPGGRGLAIVEALADSWGVDSRPSGKQVWARLSIQPHG
jgi:anti-sigma regulatory factor (Ser/Thr protein kinase)